MNKFFALLLIVASISASAQTSYTAIRYGNTVTITANVVSQPEPQPAMTMPAYTPRTGLTLNCGDCTGMSLIAPNQRYTPPPQEPVKVPNVCIMVPGDAPGTKKQVCL